MSTSLKGKTLINSKFFYLTFWKYKEAINTKQWYCLKYIACTEAFYVTLTTKSEFMFLYSQSCYRVSFQTD